jgi:hypothetical protein
MLIQLNPYNQVRVDPEISKRGFFEQFGSLNDYHKICEQCPIIDKVYKNPDTQISLGYMCRDCATDTDPRSPLERLLFGSIHTEDVFYLRQQPWFRGDSEIGEHVLSPMYLQHPVNFENTFSSRYTVIDIAFHLWKLLYTVEQIGKADRLEKTYGERVWTTRSEKEEAGREYVIIESYAIYCDGHEYHERTKEQAKRDRSIDRKLQQMGWHVFRFTGSEVFKAPQKCMADINNQIAVDVEKHQQLTFKRR